MNAISTPRTARSVCPHDCPSTCALDVEIIDSKTIESSTFAQAVVFYQDSPNTNIMW